MSQAGENVNDLVGRVSIRQPKSSAKSSGGRRLPVVPTGAQRTLRRQPVGAKASRRDSCAAAAAAPTSPASVPIWAGTTVRSDTKDSVA